MSCIRIRKTLLYGVLLLSVVACGNQQGHMDGNGMMHGNGVMGMGYWNWLVIVVVLCIGMLIGFLVAKRKQ